MFLPSSFLQVGERKRKEEAEENKILADELTAKEASAKVSVAAFLKEKEALEASGKGSDGRPLDAAEMMRHGKVGATAAAGGAGGTDRASNPFEGAAGSGAEGEDSDLVV